MNADWRDNPATKEQKEQLRFFGCTWDEGITAGMASDALDECRNQFPDVEAVYLKTLPATERQKEKLRFFGCTWEGEITVGKASDALEECAKQFPEKEASWELHKRNWLKIPGTFLAKAFEKLNEVVSKKEPIQTQKSEQALPVTHGLRMKPERHEGFFLGARSPEQAIELCPFCGLSKDDCRCAKSTIQEAAKPTNDDPKNVSFKEVTIQESAKPQNLSPQDYSIPAREVQSYAQRQPAIQKTVTYENTTPIKRFEEWLDNLLERNQTIMGGHWFPVGPMHYVLRSDAISIGLCREIADLIESKGFCVEPDARYGSGTYERDQTFALFKPLGGDAIKPSTAYLGTANLLRLCMLIATADGKIDLVELDTFRLAIENQAGLSKTDHKRLIVLEQLLAQELFSAAKVVPRIAKSISPEKRLVIGKLLVDVAAANQIITRGERRALEKIFKAFEISSETLQQMISEDQRLWKWPRPESCQDDVSKNDRWLWYNWRTGHPGVVIDDDTLTKKTWNFNDWKALNARWRAMYERLDLQPFDKSDEANKIASGRTWREEFQAAGRNLGIKSEQNPKPIPPPKDFALDMDRVYEITNETKEVIGILSVLMEDEPEQIITLPKNVTAPVPEVAKISSEVKTEPDLARFCGLDSAFHPILERLLTRDSWPQADFNALAREFNFMPLKIRDTLNEWADDALGDFILDGENPVIIRRDLIDLQTT